MVTSKECTSCIYWFSHTDANVYLQACSKHGKCCCSCLIKSMHSNSQCLQAHIKGVALCMITYSVLTLDLSSFE